MGRKKSYIDITDMFDTTSDAYKELCSVVSKIQKINKIPLKKMTDKDHTELRELLNKRAELMRKASGLNIHSLFEDK